jgi:hypothetical protein
VTSHLGWAVVPLSRRPGFSANSYQAAGFEALANELIAITRAEPTKADPDREIVAGRAEKLGLARWYVWKTP